MGEVQQPYTSGVRGKDRLVAVELALEPCAARIGEGGGGSVQLREGAFTLFGGGCKFAVHGYSVPSHRHIYAGDVYRRGVQATHARGLLT